MALNITPWSYRKKNSVLHKLPAGYKLASLLLLSVLSFLPGLIVLSGIILILISLSLIAGIGPLSLLRGSRQLFILVIAVFLFQGIEISPPGIRVDNLKETIIFCLRIAAAYSAGALLFSVTTGGEIKKSLSGLEAKLHLEQSKLSLYFSLMLGFIPQLFAIWEDLNLAWKSRGGKNNFKRIILIPLLIERMMQKAAETAEAMESRGASLN
jgi:biotin transport system permease protein